MDKFEILKKANERGFTVILGEQDAQQAYLSGADLQFPVVHVRWNGLPIDFDISWNLAERLARGESNRVIY